MSHSQQSRETWKSQFLGLVVMFFSAMIVITGCGKNSSAPPAEGIAGIQCASCPRDQRFLVAAKGSYIEAGIVTLEIALEFYGANTGAIVGSSQMGTSLFFAGTSGYTGDIAARGTLRARGVGRAYAGVAGACGVLPDGDYVVGTVTAGQWQGKSFGNLLLEARGPVNLQVLFPNNFVYGDSVNAGTPGGGVYPYKLAMEAYISSPTSSCSTGSGMGYPYSLQ